MSFASNVQMTTLTSDGEAISGRTRLNGLYYTCTDTASTIELYNGAAASGDPLVTISTPAATGAHNVIIPDGGVLFTEGIYVDLGANVSSVSLVYVGGAQPVVPPSSTYVQGVDYSAGGVFGSNSGGPEYLGLNGTNWTNTAGYNALLSAPAGTVYSVNIAGVGSAQFTSYSVGGEVIYGTWAGWPGGFWQIESIEIL
jgi:hypothetical protein